MEEAAYIIAFLGSGFLMIGIGMELWGMFGGLLGAAGWMALWISGAAPNFIGSFFRDKR